MKSKDEIAKSIKKIIGRDTTGGRLVILHRESDEEATRTPTRAQVDEFIQRDTVNGSKQLGIGVRYEDKNGNDVAQHLSQVETLLVCY